MCGGRLELGGGADAAAGGAPPAAAAIICGAGARAARPSPSVPPCAVARSLPGLHIRRPPRDRAAATDLHPAAMQAGTPTTYDVCIVGSGAGGGMAAYALTRAGARVVVLEAGPEWWATKDSTMLVPTYASPRRGGATKTRPFGEFDACDGGWEIEGEPYTRAPGTRF